MKTRRVFWVTVVLAFLAAGLYAQERAGTPPPTPQQKEQMKEQWKAKKQEMRQKAEAFMNKMQEMDKVLEQKVAAMNAATGQAKVDAMADVINTLSQEHKMLCDMMKSAHASMGEHQMGGMHGLGMHQGMKHHDMTTTGTTPQ